jgi:acetyl-CoA synthetase
MLYKVSSLFNKRLRLISLVVNRGFLTTSFDELNYLLPKSIDSYEKLYNYSVTENEQFWSCIAKNRLEWFKVFDKTTSGKFGDENFHLKWFINGKLNVSGRVEFHKFEKNCLIELFLIIIFRKLFFNDLVNCVDRHFREAPNKIALIWERDEPGTEEYVTYE